MRTSKCLAMTMLLFLLAGCQRPGPGRNVTATVDDNGRERTFHIYLPSDFSEADPAPLVIALHGGGGQGRQFDRGTTDGTLVAAAEARGVVLVFPEGIDKQWCDGRSEHLEQASGCDDVPFIAQIIDLMVTDYGIDPARVYATGISNGGFMSVRLAIDLSDQIAAVAPVTAQLSLALAGQTPQLPISIMIVNGTEDPIVPFDGGEIRLFNFGRSRGEILSTADTVTHFREHNGCAPTPAVVAQPDADPDDGTTVTVETYSGCADETEVVLVTVTGGGHTWPGGKQYLGVNLVGRASRDINASEMILDFFLAHSRETLAEG